MIINNLKVFIAFITLVVFSANANDAQLTHVNDDEKTWSFTFAPYIWAASVDGRNGPVGRYGYSPVESNMSFNEIFNDSNFSFMAFGEARHERISFFSDFSYVNFTPDQYVSNETKLNVKVKLATLALGVGYAVIDDRDTTLDVAMGWKLWHSSMRYNVSGGSLNGFSREGDATWVDVFSGFKGRHNITENLFVEGWALAGGGGAKFIWDVSGIVGYNFYSNWNLSAGYRVVDADYNRDGYVFDIKQKGPLIGVYSRF